MKTLCDCDSDPTLFDLEDSETQWREALGEFLSTSLETECQIMGLFSRGRALEIL